MRLNHPTLEALQTVRTALAWLLARNEKPDMDILAAASEAGLILVDDDLHWKADGDIVMRLAKEGLARLPSDPDHIGEVLHGMGELAAHCHAPKLSTLFVSAVTVRRGQMPLDRLFDAAVKCDQAIPRQTRVGELALGQWISRSALEWNTFQAAISRIGHPDHVLGRFGLDFAARVILRTEPSVIDRWIVNHPDHPAISVIGSAALTMVFPFGDRPIVGSLLESETTAIKCLGAATIVCPVGLQTPLDFLDGHKALVAAGFTPADATWMMGVRIKNAVHSRFGGEQGGKQNKARLQYLEQNPDKAMGGIRNAEAEMKMLRSQLERGAETQAKLLPELEAMLGDMATNWPSGGLSDAQMGFLDFIFVDAAEIRHRLAAKLSHQANRDWLLRRNVTRLQELIGLKKDPLDIPGETFRPDERRFAEISNWAAQSLILLYNSDNQGIGRQTSFLVWGMAQAAYRLITQPFISSRQPEVWQDVMTRAACAGRFVFKVVASVPQDRRESVATLNELGLEYAFRLLTARDLPAQSDAAFHELIAQAVQQMDWTSNPDEYREKWALTEDLPDFARALTLWSSPALTEKHHGLSRRLFERVCALPLSRGLYDRQMSRMLTLLDMALAASTRAGKGELSLRAKELWAFNYADWLPISIRWEGIAEKLAEAIERDGTARADIVADEAFANSHCRQLIDATSEIHVSAS